MMRVAYERYYGQAPGCVHDHIYIHPRAPRVSRHTPPSIPTGKDQPVPKETPPEVPPIIAESIKNAFLFNIECTQCGSKYVSSGSNARERFTEHLNSPSARTAFATHLKKHGAAAMRMVDVEPVIYSKVSELQTMEYARVYSLRSTLGPDKVINKCR